MCLLQSTFDNSGGRLRATGDKLATNNWRTDYFCGIDDLFYARHAECDVHRSYSREMERLQSHLGARLADRLGADGTDSRSCSQDKRP
jgi:hypothetical protein